MEYIEVTGGNPLRGSIRPAAAKNSVLPLLAATLLCAQPCTLRRVPLLRDVQTSLDLLRAVGSGAAWAGQDLVTQPARQISGRVPTALAGAMRGSVFYLAPLLTRAGWAELPLPGGCRLGPRPIDIHLAGLTAMGAQVCAAAECVALRRHGVLRGTDFALRLPSVGATLTLDAGGLLCGGRYHPARCGVRAGNCGYRRFFERLRGKDHGGGYAGGLHPRYRRRAVGRLCAYRVAGPHCRSDLCGSRRHCRRAGDGNAVQSGVAGGVSGLFAGQRLRGCPRGK